MAGQNKVSMQDIADNLSISRISVWRALTNRPGVSDELRQVIREEAKRLGYPLPDSQNHPSHDKLYSQSPEVFNRTVSVIVSRPTSSTFWMKIIHEMAKELSQNHFNLMYTYLPPMVDADYRLPESLQNGQISGIIVLNIYDENMLRLLADLKMPKIFLDTIPSMPFRSLNASLVLLEGYNLINEITGRLLDRGYKRLGFVGDINYAMTNMDRYKGFLEAHRVRDLEPDPIFSYTESLDISHHSEQIESFLANLHAFPDAFVCPSDFITHFIRDYLDKMQVKDKIILTGFDNTGEYTNLANEITTVDVQTRSLGYRLAKKIMLEIDHPGISNELSYIESKIIWKDPLN